MSISFPLPLREFCFISFREIEESKRLSVLELSHKMAMAIASEEANYELIFSYERCVKVLQDYPKVPLFFLGKDSLEFFDSHYGLNKIGHFACSYHPLNILVNSELKRPAWEELKKFSTTIKTPNSLS